MWSTLPVNNTGEAKEANKKARLNLSRAFYFTFCGALDVLQHDGA
jgi:hypothetical protein